MKARIISTIRIREGDETRKYTPGDVAEGKSAKQAIAEGCGVAIKAAKAPAKKAAKAPAKKAAKARANKAAGAPKNKSA